jgi:hypothetical protein
MLVSAAIAAYLPPLALVPQMEIATRRPPTSRAVFAATKNTTKNRLICISEQKWYAQPLLENPQIAVPLGGKNLWGRSTTVITRRNHLLCHADNPRRCDRRSKEVRRVKTRGNRYADEEVLFPGFGEFQSSSVLWACPRTDTNSFRKTSPRGALGLA